MVNASRKAGLGRTLNKAQKLANLRRNPRKSERHISEVNPDVDNARLNLRSVTAQTNLDEFFEEANLAGKQFITERRNLALINENDNTTVELYSHVEKNQQEPLKFQDIDIADSLALPRRPKWDSTTTPEQLAELEKLTFLTWRKKLAKLQENDSICLTPFEKNIEVWRQLWRVIERSDIVVQILDCRNPLLYLCDDLIKYVRDEFEGKKMNLILLNKADYLSSEQRRSWYRYFRERGLKTIFFSALLENENLKQETKLQRTSEVENEQVSDEDNHSADGIKRVSHNGDENEFVDELQAKLNIHSDDKISTENDDIEQAIRIYDKFELIDSWRDLLINVERCRIGTGHNNHNDEDPQADRPTNESDNNSVSSSHNRPLTVGLVGYPNVGKSSTINALLSAKRVAVSATPGKTKHFQTFLLDRDMMLCDCPGLVFPNFVSSKSEMVINGILPIDQMKDYVGPVRIIVSRVPRCYFEEIYGLAFDQDAKQNIIADDLLNAFAFMRGFMTARGLPDISRAARKVCKDYINGKILYCEPPPNCDKKVYHSHSKLADALKRIEERAKDPKLALKITERQSRLMKQAKGTDISAREFDAQYFLAKAGGAHIKGLPGIGNMTQPIGQLSEIKVHKREKRHKKKEKLRIVYRDLDI